MNVVRSILARQQGLGAIHDYDIALFRLKCTAEDVYRGITPNVNALDYNPEPPVFACRFSTAPGYEEVIALANEDGNIALQNTAIRKKLNEPLEGIQAHRNAIFDIAWMPGELKLVTVSGDHTVRLWDVATSSFKQIEYYQGHTRTVKTAVFRPDDRAVFATGARDGSINIWDIRASHNDRPKPDNSITNAHSIIFTPTNKHRKMLNHISRAQSITGLAFQDDYTLISCAAGDGLIKAWDLRKNYTVHRKEPLPKHVMNYSGNSTRCGFSSLLICPYKITLYASCMDNVIYAYNVSSYNPRPMAEYYGHQNCTYYVKTCLSPDGRYLASGSSDETAYIWSTNKPGGPLVKLLGHTEEVTCIAWSNTKETKIVTCSDDSCHRIWRVGFEHKGDNDEIELRGRAVSASDKSFVQTVKIETTPTTTHGTQGPIIHEHTPVPSSSSPVPGTSTDNSRLTPNGSRSSKRTYEQMTSGHSYTKPCFSPIDENIELIAKRSHMDSRGARRLFSPCNDNNILTNRNNNPEEPGTSSGHNNTATPFSPTLNLPNFVIDGTAPHLLQISPEKCKENVDWLTKIRKERYEQKMARSLLEKPLSPKSQTPARRNSRSKSTEPQKLSKTPRSPSLLNYFKLANKDDKDEGPENGSITSTSSA